MMINFHDFGTDGTRAHASDLFDYILADLVAKRDAGLIHLTTPELALGLPCAAQ